MVAFGVMLSIYMLMVLLDYSGGIDGFIGTIFFQPIIGAIASVLTIIVCVFVGLPIRLNKTLNRWWASHYVYLLSGVCGLVMLGTSFLPGLKETVTYDDGQEEITRQIPNTILSITGWFLIAFSILHSMPGESIKARAIKLFRIFFGDQHSI